MSERSRKKESCRSCGTRARLYGPAWEGAEGSCPACALGAVRGKVVKLAAWERSLEGVPFTARTGGKFWGSSGHSTSDPPRIVVTAGWCPENALAILIHEHAHHAAFRLSGPDECHGPVFREVERWAFEEWLGTPLVVEPQDSVLFGGTGRRQHRYAQTAAFTRILLSRARGADLSWDVRRGRLRK